METLGEVARWGLNHDPPHQYGLGYPHFYSSSAARPFFTRRVCSLHFLLLRSAVDVEVHGGSIEALSVTDVTCCHLEFSSRRRRAERGSKFSPPLILRAAPTRGPHFPRGVAMASSGP